MTAVSAAMVLVGTPNASTPAAHNKRQHPPSPIMSIRQTNIGLVSFRHCHGLLDFSAAVRALVDEVDLRHAPMGRDVSYVHRKS